VTDIFDQLEDGSGLDIFDQIEDEIRQADANPLAKSGTRQDVMGFASPEEQAMAQTVQRVVKPVPALAASQAVQGAGGKIRQFGDTLTQAELLARMLPMPFKSRAPSPTSAPAGMRMAEAGHLLAREGQTVEGEIQRSEPLEPGSWANSIRGGMASTYMQVPSMIAAGPLVKAGQRAAGLATSLLPLGEITGGQSYEKYRERGFDPATANVGAGVEELVEVGTELLPMDTALSFATGKAKAGIRELAKLALKFNASEYFGEALATLGQDVTDKYLSDPKLTPEQRQQMVDDYFTRVDSRTGMTEAWANFEETMRATTVQNLLMQGGAGMARLGAESAGQETPLPAPPPIVRPPVVEPAPPLSLPAPAIAVTPEGTAVTSQQMTGLVNQGLATQRGGMSPAQIAESRQKLAAGPLRPSVDVTPSRVPAIAEAELELTADELAFLDEVDAYNQRGGANGLSSVQQEIGGAAQEVPAVRVDDQADQGQPETVDSGAVAKKGNAARDWDRLEEMAAETPVDVRAHEAATSPANDLPQPTEAQAKAGNYKKGHVSLHGLDISIENPKGSARSGIDPGGKPWSVRMPAHYGYVKRTTGADGDQVDVYVGPNPESSRVFVVDQLDHKTGKFDEHKAILGTDNRAQAASLYRAGFSDMKGSQRLGAMTEMSVEQFRGWLKEGNTAKPLGGTLPPPVAATVSPEAVPVAPEEISSRLNLVSTGKKRGGAPIYAARNIDSSIRQTLTEMRQEIAESESGFRMAVGGGIGNGGTAETVASPSTFPQYFQNKGFNKNVALAAIDRYLSGKGITSGKQGLGGQAATLVDLVAAKRKLDAEKLRGERLRRIEERRAEAELFAVDEAAKAESLSLAKELYPHLTDEEAARLLRDDPFALVEKNRIEENVNADRESNRNVEENVDSTGDDREAGGAVARGPGRSAENSVESAAEKSSAEPILTEQTEAGEQVKLFATPPTFGKKPQRGESVTSLDFELPSEERGLFEEESQKKAGPEAERVAAGTLSSAPAQETANPPGAEAETVVSVTTEPATPANTFFTEDAYQKARERMRRKLDGRLNSGFDPELLQDGLTVAGYHLERGARKFGAYAKAMIEEFGEGIKPYLKAFYNGVRDLPGIAWTKEMDDYAAVSGFDLDSAEDSDTIQQKERADVTEQRRDGDLERDRGNAAAQDSLGEEGVSDDLGSDVPAGERGVRKAESRRGAARRGKRLSGREAAAAGERGDFSPYREDEQRLSEVGAAGGGFGGRSGDAGFDGLAPDHIATETVGATATGGVKLIPKRRAQVEAQSVKVIPGDKANIDQSLPFLHEGQRSDVLFAEQRFAKPDGYGVLFTNGTGTGKAQPLDAKVLTPSGWRLMGDIRPHDAVIAADGTATEVLAVYPQGEKEIYRVEFSDGAATECCAEHLWLTQTLYERRKGRENPEYNCAQPEIRSLEEIRTTLDKQHFIPIVQPVRLYNRELPIPGYVLGVLLGDGCLRGGAVMFSTEDREIAAAVSHVMAGAGGRPYSVRPVRVGAKCPTYRISVTDAQRNADGTFSRHPMADALREYGLMGCDSSTKFIPQEYLDAQVEERTALLRGLLDTDGWVDRRTGSIYFTTVSELLAADVVQLARSLGGVVTVSKKHPTYTYKGERRYGRDAFNLCLHLPNSIVPFSLPRKLELVTPKLHAPRRKIVSVASVGKKQAQCLTIAHPAHLYVTDDFIVTHNTYSGLGIVKRFERQDKTNTLILVPDDKAIKDWIDSGKNLGLEIAALANTKDAGRGIVVTTYANAGQNDALAQRDWNLIVPDESQKLMEGKDAKATLALETLRAVSNHPGGKFKKHSMLYRKEIEERQRLHDQLRANLKRMNLDDTMDQVVDALRKENDGLDSRIGKLDALLEKTRQEVYGAVDGAQGAGRTRVVFLSATPFAYEKSVDYAEGYLFDYPEAGKIGNSNQGGFEKFMVEHFGYRIRYHKLTEPGPEVNSGLMQRQFNSWLKKEQVLSGRMLDVDQDYDRKFVLTENAVGAKIDEGLQFLWENKQYWPLWEKIQERFDHLSRRYLLEAIKAREAVPLVREHLEAGRKVVVFHDYKKGGGFNPFDLSQHRESAAEITVQGEEEKTILGALVQQFEAERPDLVNIDLRGLVSPVESFQNNFPDVLIVNGDRSKKDNMAAFERFNDDATGPQVMLVQSAKNAGWSGHDTTGKYPRVMFNLGLPTRPTMAIQQEGRIYRVGQASNAMFRYLNTGTNWERFAFATTIAHRSSAAENLALGEEARALMDAFIHAFEESDAYPVGHEGEGTGGKERDRAANAALSEWDRALTMYFAQHKKTSRTKSMEGVDYFATPEPLGLKMVEWAGIRDGETVLEPSAGHGAIARWFPDNVARTVIEPSAELASRLKMVTDAKLMQENFEDLHVVNKFDAIVMNPPFGSGGKTAIEHLDKATTHLREGGRVVALIPTGPAADKRFEKWFYEEDAKGKSLRPELHLAADISLPAVTFERAGTKVASRIVIIDKLADGQDPVYQASRDYSAAKDIKEFFERIEEAGIDRPEAPARKEAPTAVEEGGFALEQTTHAKKGIDLFVATPTAFMEREAFEGLKRTAKKHGGYYSRYKAQGAIPGFQFESEESRSAFVAAAESVGQSEEIGYNDDTPKFSINPTGDRDTYDRMRGGIYVVPEQVQPATLEKWGTGGLREAEENARASLRSVRLDDERGQGAEPWSAREKHAREVILPAEREALRSWAKENDLLIPASTFERMWQRDGKRGGREHDVFLDRASGRWYKRQRFSLNSSYTDYFQRLILTNKLNHGRADYRFEGFVEQAGELFPVVSQADVVSSHWLTNTDIHNLLTERGFKRMDDGPPGMMGWWKVPGEDYVFTDLNGQNATIDDAGNLVFIDPFIEPDYKTQAERMEAELYLDELEGKGYRFAARGKRSVVAALSDVEFEAIFERITSGIKDPAARNGFVVTATASELPSRILAEIKKQGNNPNEIDGVFHRGKVYLVRENITSAERLEEVLFHEWHGHAGLFAMFGNDGGKLKAAMVNLYNTVTPGRLYPLGRKYGINLMKYGQALGKAGYDLDTRRAIMAEEMLAFLTQEYSKGTIARKVREVVGQIRAWLREHGFAKLAEWGETDIAWLLKRARSYAEAGAWAKDGPAVPVNGEEILARLRDAGITEEMLSKLLSGTPRFAAAYHGGPHDFDRFSTAAIGTGEGAQVFGYGLYFASSRAVAEHYREALGSSRYGTNNGQMERFQVIDEMTIQMERDGHATSYQAMREVANNVLNAIDDAGSVEKYFKGYSLVGGKYAPYYESAHKAIKSIMPKVQKGRLYQVELAPTEDEYLLWDKPLSEQSEKVKAALSTAMGPAILKDGSGRNLYHHLSGNMSLGSDKAASEYLHSLGIRGIKYLDGTSRGNGEGNFNYVIFDENDVEITAKFSIAQSAKDKAAAQKSFISKLTPDKNGLPYAVLSGKIIPERIKAAVGSVLSNPHYGAKKSKWKGAAYDLGLERGANANEIKHEIMASRDDYAGLEGVRDECRKMKKAERADLDNLLVEGDVRGEEYAEELLRGASNPLGRAASARVIRGYLAFRETIAQATRTMFDRLGRLRLIAYEGSDYYDELVELLKRPNLSADELAREFGIHKKAVDAYLQIRADRKKLDAAVKPYRDQAWYDTLRDMLAKGMTTMEVSNEHYLSRDLVKAFAEVRKNHPAGFVTAEKFKKAAWYKILSDLLTQGDDHPMLQKLELYNAYLGVMQYDSRLAELKEQWGKVKGYLPRIRKDGEQHVKVRRVEGDGTFTEAWMQPAKNEYSAGKLRDKVEANLKDYIPHSFDPKAQYDVAVERNTATPEEIFMGIGSHRAIEGLLSKVFDKAMDAGIIENPLEVQAQVLRILADEISARGFGRHRLSRTEHLIEGYETQNTPAILAQFVGGMAGWLSKSEFAMRANKLMSQIPSNRPEDKTWVREYVDDALKNSTYLDQWFGTARSFASLMFLGFKASSAVLNATQNYVWGQAQLSKHTRGATMKLLRAQHDVVKDHLLRLAGKPGILTEEEQWVMDEGLRRGRSHANYVRAMAGMDDTGGVMGGFQAGTRWLTEKAMIPFQAVETYWNREPALLAAYRVFKGRGMEKEAALKAAEKFVDDVHFVIGKENIPAMLRKMGPAGRMLYTFQSYSHNYLLGMLTSMKQGEVEVVVRSLTALVLFGGLAAVPFGDDLDKWYRRIFGERPLRMLERWLRETAGEYTDFGDQIADFVLHGAPALAGVNFSRAIGVNIPWLSAEDDSLAERVMGVWGGLAQKVRMAGVAAAKGDGFRVVESLSPEALANIMRAYRHYADGATTLSGRPIFGDDGNQVKYTAKEAIIRGFGFMPLEPSKQTQNRWDARQAKDYWSERKADVLAQWRRAETDEDYDRVLNAVDKLNEALQAAPGGALVAPISGKTLKQVLRNGPDWREMEYLN